MWVFGGQTYALAHQRSPGSEGRVIVYLSDLWRVRCRPSNGSCGNQWGGGWNETRRQHNASDNSGGGMIWLKLDLFRNTSATNGSKDGPGPRASAALSHHVSERGTRRLLLFGGYNGGEYLDVLWEWSIWGSGHVDDAYYEGRTNPYPARCCRRPRWSRRVSPPSTLSETPSARGATSPRPACGRRRATRRWASRSLGAAPSTSHSAARRRTTRRSTQRSCGRTNPSARCGGLPARNDGPAAREETCSAIGRGPYGTRLFAFGGMREEHLYGGEPFSDELWM